MERHEYAVMFKMEEDYWWYRGLHDMVMRCISRFARHSQRARLLDAGCGTGRLLQMFGGSDSYGIDCSPEAFKFLKVRGLANAARASVCGIPFKDKVFTLVVSLDVLYHCGVRDDVKAIAEFHRVLEPGGVLILNLPAFELFRGAHDAAVHTQRRYRIKDVRGKLEKAGFDIALITYRNTLLLPAAMAVRLMRRSGSRHGHGVRSDLMSLPGWVNRLFYLILMFENRLLLQGLTFPLGLSVFCVAKKDKEETA
ncbi:MAG: class I SAM-dependent methyltransferase [bacterium]